MSRKYPEGHKTRPYSETDPKAIGRQSVKSLCDSKFVTLSNDARQAEIQEAKSRMVELRAEIERAPVGVDTSELRRQFFAAMGKSGKRHRASDNWGTPEELAETIAKWFDEKQVLVVEDGEVVGTRQRTAVTLTGLANLLGVDRKTLMTYATNNDEYGPVIMAARQKIEELYEGRLVYGDKPVGTIFALKNMGWSDNMTLTTDTSERRMTSEEIAQAINEDII